MKWSFNLLAICPISFGHKTISTLYFLSKILNYRHQIATTCGKVFFFKKFQDLTFIVPYHLGTLFQPQNIGIDCSRCIVKLKGYLYLEYLFLYLAQFRESCLYNVLADDSIHCPQGL